MMNDSIGHNNGLLAKFSMSYSLHGDLIKKYIILLYFINMIACAADPVVAPMEELPTGANQQQSLAYAQAVGALFLNNGMSTGCSVAFINDRYAVTAARCIEQNPIDYKILIESPADPSSPGFTLNSAKYFAFKSGFKAGFSPDFICSTLILAFFIKFRSTFF